MLLASISLDDPVLVTIAAVALVLAVVVASIFRGERAKTSSAGESAEAAPEATKVCPFCRETIKAEATTCRYCKRNLDRDGSLGAGCGCLIALLIVGFLVWLVGWSQRGFTSPPATKPARKASVDADVTVEGFQLKIRNNGPTQWRDIKLTLNDEFNVSYPMCVVGQTLEFGLGEFATSDGLRFVPWQRKPVSLMVRCSDAEGTRLTGGYRFR